MIRAVILAAAIAGCAEPRGVYVAAGSDPIGAAIGELLHLELAGRPEGARRVRCGDAVDCVAKLRGRAIDVAVLERDELQWLAPAGELVIAAELPVERTFALVARAGGFDTAAPRLGVASSFAARARGGLADLARARNLSPRPQRIDDPAERAVALERGAIDAAVFETWRRPVGVDTVATIRGGRLVVVTRADVTSADPDRIGRAAGAVSVRLEQLGDRLWAAIAGGVDPIAAVKSLAPPDRSPPDSLVLAVAPVERSRAAVVARALASRSVDVIEVADPAAALASGRAALALLPANTAAVAGAEMIAVYAGDAELWSRAGLLERADGRRILATSTEARMPAGDRPSAWMRLANQPVAVSRGAGRGLDTLINVAVAAFLVWLLVLIVRAREPADR